MAPMRCHPASPTAPQTHQSRSGTLFLMAWQIKCHRWLFGNARLLKEWRTEQEYEVIDVGMGYFIVRFAMPVDCSRILTGGPYKFFDHYLAIQPWEPSFHPVREKAPKTAVWVKLHGAPSMCFHEAIVLYLASKLGKPIKVDSVTLLGAREKFARVCVEVDLSQKLPSTLDLDPEELPQTMVLVEYEGLHRICFHCVEFGHTEDYCHYKHPGKTISTGNPNAQAMIELTQALKPNMAENNMEPTRNRKPDQPTKVSASLQAILRIMVKPRGVENGNGAKSSQQNRFAIMEDLIDEETDLIGAIKGKEVIEAGNSENSSGDSLAMDITHSPVLEAQLSSPTHQEVSKSTALPLVPPPTLDSSSVKPKSKLSKKKTKTLGPVPKESKTSAPKPYDPPTVSKKQSDSSLVPSSTLPPAGISSNVSIGQAAPTMPPPTQQAATTLQMLPSIQVAPMSLLETPSTPNLSQAGKPSLTLRPDQNLVANHTSQLTRQVPPLVSANWVVMGDFNYILLVDEAFPKATKHFVRAQRFRDRLSSCGLHSTKPLGCKYTWLRKQNRRVLLRERLDRALFNMLALEAFLNTKVINLPWLCSDHHLVLLYLEANLQRDMISKPIRFEVAWLTHEDFKLTFKSAWASHRSSIIIAIKSIQEACLKWNKEVFGITWSAANGGVIMPVIATSTRNSYILTSITDMAISNKKFPDPLSLSS
ncbi:hypothetical protein SLEP1_g51593 [Rubroshorea leprosula]|uniref:DUF4283 domain-containing protein n=1 Tax=Rubroshorea leprosula TaxID=152421 RepID=A0AAV5M3N7_9ROSI|nr:hypothetical protein SLEP1_g51593 [Rubroshorea leprosula]